jgi:hypothetical protein
LGPSQVPPSKQGSPSRRILVSALTVPFAPSQSALIRKIATATGYSTMRWAIFGQSRVQVHRLKLP